MGCAIPMHNSPVCGQEEGYQGALGCDGETHNDVRLKVEPCRCAIMPHTTL